MQCGLKEEHEIENLHLQIHDDNQLDYTREAAAGAVIYDLIGS